VRESSRLGAILVALTCGCRYGFDAVSRDADPFATDVDPFAVDGAASANDGAGSAIDGAGDAGMLVSLVGPLVTADTALSSAGQSFNYGGGAAFNVRNDAISQFTALIRFDLSTIPPGTTIVAAELRVTTGNTALSSGQVTAFELLQNWDEGAAVGAAGTANWDDRASGNAWLAGGAGPGSRATTAIAVVLPYQTDTEYTITLPASQLQNWVDAPGTNFGLALVASGTGMGDTVGFVSSEGPATAQPKLVVTTGM